MGWNEWAALYTSYIVLGSKISVKVTQSTSAPVGRIGYAGVYLSNATAAPYTTAAAFIEARRGIVKALSPLQSRPVSVGAKFSAKKFFNVKDIKDNWDDLGALVTTNPATPAYYQIWYQDVYGTASTINLEIIVDYIILFREPIDMVQS